MTKIASFFMALIYSILSFFGIPFEAPDLETSPLPEYTLTAEEREFLETFVETERAVFYYADFVYLEVRTNKMVVEDVKSPATKKNKEYIIKRKLFKYLYKNYEFREV